VRRLILLAIPIAVFAVAALLAARTPNISLCQGIATQIRQNAANSPGDPIAPLFKGDHPYIETPSKADIEVLQDPAQFAELFRQKFHPSDAMSHALDDFSSPVMEVFSLPDSNLHMIQTIEGSAHCGDFRFFWMPTGDQSQPLPNLPRKGTRDGDNMICEGFGDHGFLARVAGNDAFIETMWSPENSNSELRVAPFQQGNWGPACKVEADFGTEYRVSQVFVPASGPISDVAIKEVAAEIVEQHADAKDPKSFIFGPPVPEGEEENVRTMEALAAKRQSWNRAIPFTAFGREKELDAFQSTLGLIDNYPVVLYGNTYLVAIGRGVIGWRESPDTSGLILYKLNDGKLQPVGSAIVQQTQGALKSVRATPWTLRSPAH
jgi:hypothetical protein